jgi:hypothetical protein
MVKYESGLEKRQVDSRLYIKYLLISTLYTKYLKIIKHYLYKNLLHFAA